MTKKTEDAELPVVLVVDDDTIHLEILELYLSGNARPHFADSGEAALQKAKKLHRSHPNATVLMDLRMPGLSGAELVKALREESESFRIIGMSASEPAPGTEILRADFLLKPIEEDVLKAALNRTESRAAAPQDAPAGGPQHLRMETLAKLEAMLPPAALKRLFDVYIEDTETRIAVLHECEAGADNHGAAQAAHALKGSSGMMGFEHMARLTSTLEAHCNGKSEFSLTEEIKAIEAEFSIVRNILGKKLDALKT